MKVLRAWTLSVLALVLIGAVGCGSDGDGTASSTTGGGDTTEGTTGGDPTATTSGDTTGEPIEIRIAQIADLTGPAKAANEQQVAGIELALDVLAEQGLVDITIDRRDTSGDVARATATMTEVAADDSIVWQFGPANTGEFFAAIPIADQLQIPIDSISSGGVYTEEFNDYSFRTSFAENAATEALVSYIQDDLGFDDIAALYANDNDFARTSAEYFVSEAQEAGINLTTQQTFSTQDINFSTQTAGIVSSDPEAVYVATNVNAGLVVKALRDAGFDGPIVATNNTFHTPQDVFDTSGGATEGVFFVAPYDPNDDRQVVADFVAAFAEKYDGAQPTVQNALGYDAVMMLAQAVTEVDGEITRESLRDAFAATHYEGITGTDLSFPDGKGDVRREGIHILTIEAPGVAVAAD